MPDPMTRDELIEVGQALHGKHWQSPLSRELGVAHSTIWRWLKRPETIPRATAELLRLKMKRAGG